MTEQEKQTVAAAKEFGASDLTQDLVILVERLDKQLIGLVEMGDPLLKEIETGAKILQKRFCAYGSVQGAGLKPSGFCDCKYIQVVRTGSTEETGCCESRQIILLSRRLAQALKEVRGD